MQSNANVLQVENIITRFNTQDGKVFAVNGISFDLKEGELLGVVGESGSGKSVTMMSLLKLLPMPSSQNLPCHSWGLVSLRIFQPRDACFVMLQLSFGSLLQG